MTSFLFFFQEIECVVVIINVTRIEFWCCLITAHVIKFSSMPLKGVKWDAFQARACRIEK